MSDISRTPEQQEPKTFLQKAKSAFNRAKMSRYLGFVTVVAATVVISLYQVGWDPWRIGWQTYIANTSLLLFLGIYGLFFGESEGGNLYKTLVTGLYQAVKVEFLDKADETVDKGYADALPDYIVWRYQKDYEAACKMKLMSVRVFKPSICDLTDEELEHLRHAPLEVSETEHYSQLSEEQYKAIMGVRGGRVFVDYIDDYAFYLNESNTDGEQQVTRVKNTPKRKEKIAWKQRLTRVLMILIVSLIIAGFFKQAWEGDNETAPRDLLSRLSTLVVSVASGVNTARLINMEDVFVLRYKTSYLNVFLASMGNGTFKPVDQEEKAKREYEEYKKRQEEAEKAVVEPEPAHETEVEEHGSAVAVLEAPQNT